MGYPHKLDSGDVNAPAARIINAHYTCSPMKLLARKGGHMSALISCSGMRDGDDEMQLDRKAISLKDWRAF